MWTRRRASPAAGQSSPSGRPRTRRKRQPTADYTGVTSKTSTWLEVGVAVARAVQLESDQDYGNDGDSRADAMLLEPGLTGHQVGTIAVKRVELATDAAFERDPMRDG